VEDPLPSTVHEPPEDILEVSEDLGIPVAPGVTTDMLTQALDAVAVVDSPLLLIDEDRVGLRNLLELLLGFFIPGIPVGMVLEGQSAVSLLDFLFGSVPGYAENSVIILHGPNTLIRFKMQDTGCRMEVETPFLSCR